MVARSWRLNELALNCGDASGLGAKSGRKSLWIDCSPHAGKEIRCNGLQSKPACSQSTGIVTPFWGCLRYQLYLHKI